VIYGLGFILGTQRSWTDFLATVLFLRSYVPTSPGLWNSPIPIGHLWSLNVEEHVYLVMSALTLIAWKRKAVVLLGLGLLCFAIHIAYLRLGAPRDWELHTEVVAANILLAAGYSLVRFEGVKPWMPLAACAVVPGLYTHYTPWWTQSMLAPMLLAFAVSHLAAIPASVRRVLEWPALRRMGVWSFSIYLWQQPFFEAKMVPLAGIGLAVATGLMSYYFLERPARTWLNSRAQSRRITSETGPLTSSARG
jgi:peptidoglycan/LPS O-acetylase OafA/YrhL